MPDAKWGDDDSSPPAPPADRERCNHPASFARGLTFCPRCGCRLRWGKDA